MSFLSLPNELLLIIAESLSSSKDCRISSRDVGSLLRVSRRLASLLTPLLADIALHLDKDQMTPLQWAAYTGHEGLVRLLLRNGVDVNFHPSKEDVKMLTTALHLAAETGNGDMVKLLLTNGADSSIRSLLDGTTALHWGVHSYSQSVVRLLLENGADPSAQDGTGKTPLHWGARNGDEASVRQMFEKGADLAVQDVLDGATALHWAAHMGQEKMVRLLLEKGADVTARDHDGNTAIDWAAKSMNQGPRAAVIRMLQQKGSMLSMRCAKHEKMG